MSYRSTTVAIGVIFPQLPGAQAGQHMEATVLYKIGLDENKQASFQVEQVAAAGANITKLCSEQQIAALGEFIKAGGQRGQTF